MPPQYWTSALLFLRYSSKQIDQIDAIIMDWIDARKPADFDPELGKSWYDLRWIRAQVNTKLNKGWSRKTHSTPPVALVNFKAWLENAKVRIN